MWEWWIQQSKNKTCVYSGSWWIYETAYGKFSTELSWGPYCRKRREFITALQFGSQIYSYASSVPIVVPGLSSSSSGSSSTSRTPSRQESHCSSSSSSSSSSPTVSEFQTRERGDQTESDISPVHVSTTVDDRSGRPDDNQANKNPKNNQKESKREQSDPLCSDTPEWLQELREILVDDEIPVHGNSHAISSHEASWEPIFKRREDLGKHSVYTHFPKDRNCEICQRTKITRAPSRTRNGGAVPRAEYFGDMITADHKVLSDNCESRNNHRYAVVVQDLATQWIQAYPCKNKTSQETQRSLQKFLEPERKPKVIYTDNSLEFGKACEDLSWNHCTSTPHRSESNGTSTSIRHRPIQGESNIDFLGESEGSLPTPHDSFPDACEAINDFWSMSGKFIYRHHVEPRVKLYESNFTRRERNHSLFHWNTLTYPELLTRIWKSSKRSASMITGISMDLETCQILGQVSHNLLYSMNKLLTDICGPGGD